MWATPTYNLILGFLLRSTNITSIKIFVLNQQNRFTNTIVLFPNLLERSEEQNLDVCGEVEKCIHFPLINTEYPNQLSKHFKHAVAAVN